MAVWPPPLLPPLAGAVRGRLHLEAGLAAEAPRRLLTADAVFVRCRRVDAENVRKPDLLFPTTTPNTATTLFGAQGPLHTTHDNGLFLCVSHLEVIFNSIAGISFRQYPQLSLRSTVTIQHGDWLVHSTDKLVVTLLTS
ncbi:unnamed protein product [Acanthoscelides obtectus]|uniref:Uncharacterized protein n=1 Tax=Acanthoscelides obtectus TaxID=200917 RepID=A0A9P0JKJ6_ACAOB|nr:unnamed protein product [Acanthoscelides obtectus]CAK1672990.1 hypothetical protein AOBTE_LOCUS29176 [Acanthoscelides obtectus]